MIATKQDTGQQRCVCVCVCVGGWLVGCVCVGGVWVHVCVCVCVA